MSVSVEEVKAFKLSAQKYRENWLNQAKRSWNEIKKVQSNGKMYSLAPDKIKKRSKYPTWYSIHQIRKPLYLSRVGIPIGRDATQDGNDHIGATAAILKERLVKNLAKDCEFFEVMLACRDDALATNFTTARAYYECEEVTERVREYITPQKVGEDVFFYDSNGQVVVTDDIKQDDEGYFIESEETVDIEREKICLEPVLYSDIYVDPEVRNPRNMRRLGLEHKFSRRQFKLVFGAEALSTLPNTDSDGDASETKTDSILVFEYWDLFERKCYWLAENGTAFIKPKSYLPEDREYELDRETNGLYDLDGFFPIIKPFVLNAPTDSFWPVTEYYQIIDILEDIHSIFTRMFRLTKAIVTRLLYDSSVDGLQPALHESAEADTFGVPNLAQALANAGGKLDNVVQYINVAPMVEALNNLYAALEQRLNTVYKLTGTSDLLQGFVTDQTDRTFGERQMQEKYALNQIAEGQRKMQEFVRDGYELLGEMAIKNFTDKSLEEYINPTTLPDEHKPRYAAALEMLKQHPKRFRIELETDSTVAINEEYNKAMNIEMINALTAALEKTASIAQQSPELLTVELHALKTLVQQYRPGKLFQGEISEAIDNVIESAKLKAQQPPPFNKDEADLAVKQREMNDRAVLEQMKLISQEKIEVAKIQHQQTLEAMRTERDSAIAGLKAQIDTFKAQLDQGKEVEKLRLGYAELAANVEKSRNELSLKLQELFATIKKDSDDTEIATFRAQTEAMVAGFDAQIRQAEQKLEEFKGVLDLRERYMTEARLQQESRISEGMAKIEMLAKTAEVLKPAPEPAKTINIQAPKVEQPSTANVIRDADGNMIAIQAGSRITNIKRDESGNIVALEHQKSSGNSAEA